jgi:hypothetical protein
MNIQTRPISTTFIIILAVSTALIISAVILLSSIATQAKASEIAPFASLYEYVSANGTLETIIAVSADDAVASAHDIAPHSGVVLLGRTTVMSIGGSIVITTTPLPPNTTQPVLAPQAMNTSPTSPAIRNDSPSASTTANQVDQDGNSSTTPGSAGGISGATKAVLWTSLIIVVLALIGGGFWFSRRNV